MILKSRWTHYAVLALLCVGLLVRGNYYHADRNQWRDNYRVQKKAYNAASAAAEAQQKALYASISARQNDKARSADESNRIAQDRARSAVAGYSERMRLDRVCARQANPSSQTGPAQDRDGQGAATEFVAVTKNDFELMVANSVRLEEVRKWGDSLIADGLAEPLPDPAFGAK